MKKSAFISYARKDRKLLDSLFDDLKSLHCNIWFDQDQLNGGMPWWEEILRQIREADLVVVVLSRASRDSLACRRECDYALALGKPVLPVRVDATLQMNTLPAELQALHAVDFFTGSKAELAALANTLRTLSQTAAKPLPSPLPEPPDIPLSYAAEILQQLNDTKKLEESEQAALVQRLRDALRTQQQRDEALELLRIFRQRRDLLAVTAKDLDELLQQYAKSRIVIKGIVFTLFVLILLFVAVVAVPRGKGEDPTPTPTPTPTPKIRTYPLTLDVQPENASVKFSNRSESYRPGMLLPAGRYELLVTAPGYRDWRDSITLTDGSQPFQIKLEKMQAKLLITASPANATLTISRKDGSSLQSVQSGRDVALAEGVWLIKASATGYEDQERSVQLEANDQPQRQSIELKAKPRPLQAGEERVFDGIPFVWIPPGEFDMGSPEGEGESDEHPQHRVRIAEGFWLEKFEVTKGEFSRFVAATDYRTEAETDDGCYAWTGSEWKKDKQYYWRNVGFPQTDDHPVACVSWNDVQAFLKWKGQGYRLPTEAEWEYAARAKSTTPFSTGKCINTNQANYDGRYPFDGCPKGEYRQASLAVGSLAHNDWNLYDMHGNVWEWTSSLYENPYDGSELRGSSVSDTGSRVLRGGSWYNSAINMRSAYRNSDTPSNRSSSIGFRLVRSAPRQDR